MDSTRGLEPQDSIENPKNNPRSNISSKPSTTKDLTTLGGNPEPPKLKKFKTDIDIIRARGCDDSDEKVISTVGQESVTQTESKPEKELMANKIPEAVKQKTGKQNEAGEDSSKKGNNRDDRGNRGNSKNNNQKRKGNWKYNNHSRSKNSRTEDGEDPAEPLNNNLEKRLPKRKVAVMLGYYGKGYQGSQVNPGMKTIEGEVFKAFVNAGCISEENSAHPNKVGLQRAARTDANVHAGCNLISLKLILNPPSLSSGSVTRSPKADQADCNLNEKTPGVDPLVNHINSYLPEEIRIWDFIRVQNSFQARTFCDSRTYEYSLPTYLFLPPRPGTAMYKRLNSTSFPGGNGGDKKWSDWYEDGEIEARWWIDHPEPIPNDPQEILKEGEGNCFSRPTSFKSSLIDRKSNYRISAPMINRIRECVQKFKGTHNFHNFTVGKEFKERNSIRIMRDVTVSDPFIVGQKGDEEPGTEWISIKFYGQSFMLHQIRKMVGLVVLMCRTRTPSSLVPELYGPTKVGIPKAPGLGLILQSPHFDGYNKRILEANQQIISKQNSKSSTKKNSKDTDCNNNKKNGKDEDPFQSDLIREPIELKRCKGLIEKFKKEVLYCRMWEEEKEENGFGVWINYLDVYRDSDLDFLNPNGAIPESITKKSSIESKRSNSNVKNNGGVPNLTDSDLNNKSNENEFYLEEEDEKLTFLNGDEIEEG